MAVVKRLLNGSFSVYWNPEEFHNFNSPLSFRERLDISSETKFKCKGHEAVYKLELNYVAAKRKFTLKLIVGKGIPFEPMLKTSVMIHIIIICSK